MSTIVAICPYCRSGGVRAKGTALGASAKCPKCKSSFTIVPDDDLPDWVAKASADAVVISAPSGEKPKLKLPAVEETRAMDALDVTEPSPVLPAEPRPQPRPAAQTAPVFTPDAGEPAAPTDAGFLLALGALTLVGPTVLASQLPFGRIIALALAAIGFVGGLLCLGAEGRARIGGALAALLHAGVAVVVLLLPSWLNLDPWDAPPIEEPQGPVVIEHGTGIKTMTTPGAVLDAGRSSWQLKDVRVTVRSVVGPVELRGPDNAKRMTKESYLQISVHIANVGFEREVSLSGWAAGLTTDGVRVTDGSGKQLDPAKFEGTFTPDRGRPAPRAMPGNVSEVRFLFPAPPKKTDSVQVQLSGVAFGYPEDIKFRISALGLQVRPPGSQDLPR